MFARLLFPACTCSDDWAVQVLLVWVREMVVGGKKVAS